MWSIPSSNPEGKAFMIIIVVFLIIAVVAYGLRVYSRRLGRQTLDASDALCCLALVLDISLTVITLGTYSHGIGQDATNSTPADAEFLAKVFIAGEIVWMTAAVSARLSIILFCFRIFATHRFQMVCWVLVAINVAGLISVVLSMCLICQPISYSFDKTISGGHCGNLEAFAIYTAVFSLLLDSTVFILPLPVLWKLQMRTKRKIALSAVMGLGLVIVILTLTRVVLTVYLVPQNSAKEKALSALLTALEPILGVINACLPFMPSVVKRIGQTTFFQRDLASIKPITWSHKRDSARHTEVFGMGHSGQYKGLPDIEMGPVKGSIVVSGVSSAERQDAILDGQPWDNPVSKS